MISLIAFAFVADGVFAQRGPGRGRGRGRGGPGFRGGRQDPTFEADRDVFHFLLANGDKIRRTIKKLENGVETVTESDDEDIAAKIQEHVAAMYDRIKENRPIHMRDPLFREVFSHVDKIKLTHEETDQGIRVKETSDDPYVATLIQEHAKVVSLFIKNGFAEARKNHAVPPRGAEKPQTE
jgi:hypothetical protein